MTLFTHGVIFALSLGFLPLQEAPDQKPVPAQSPAQEKPPSSDPPAKPKTEGQGTEEAQEKPEEAKQDETAEKAESMSEEEIVKLFRAAAEEVAKVKSVGYRGEVRGLGVLEATYIRHQGQVTLQKIEGEDPLGAKFIIRAERTEKDERSSFQAVYDGQTFGVYHAKDDAVTRVDPQEDEGILSREETRLLCREFITEKPFENVFEAESLKYEGRRAVEGVECHVVYVEYEPEWSQRLPESHLRRETKRMRFWLGVEDRLPRRIEYLVSRRLEGDPKDLQAGVGIILADLKVNPEIPADAFVLDWDKKRAKSEVIAKVEPGKKPEKVETSEKTKEEKKEGKTKLQVGDVAPPWELKDVEGKVHRLSDYKGKIVVGEVWCSFYEPSVQAKSGTEEVAKKYKEQGVIVLGFNAFEKSPQDALEILKGKNYSYPQLLEADKVAKSYNAKSLPGFFVIDREGKLAFRGSGYDDMGKKMENVLDVLLGKKEAKEKEPKEKKNKEGEPDDKG